MRLLDSAKVSRRQLFRYTVAGLAAGVSPAAYQDTCQASDLGLSYRLYPDGSAPRPFGIVKNFSEHIRHRADVRREILFWLTDGRASFLGGTGRFQFIEPMIRPLYERAGIPIELGFGLGMQESLFRNYSISYANAKGIWQMQWAGQRYGLRGGDYFDIARSTEKQVEYLRDLVRAFDWNLELVAVDYNYGPGHRFAPYRSDPHAFQKIYRRLPRETQRFVPRVLAAAALGLEPQRYGMSIPRLDARTLAVPAPRDLHHLEVALLLGADHWNLGNLNPRESIRVWFKEGERIILPQVYEEDYHAAINDHPLRDEFHSLVSGLFTAPEKDVRYVVKRGDTLGRIAREFAGCGVQGQEHVMLYNGLTSPTIRPGQELLIPCTR